MSRDTRASRADRAWPVLCAGLVVGGLLAAGTAATAEPPAATARDVRPSTAALPIRGVVRAKNQATISTELVARVAVINFKEGQRFRKGDVVIGFDCRRQQAELASAQAQHREMTVTLESNAFLEKRNAASRQDVEVARARADKAAAEVEALRVRLDQCNVVAPFEGRVGELYINEHEMSVAGKPLVQILADADYEIDVIAPSEWLVSLAEGEDFTFVIDETRRSYTGTIVRIGAAVDTTSQTIKITGRFKAVDTFVLPGMSGTAQFSGAKG